ncbi:low-specificity L-threonine aldolase [Kordiimonas sp. SCSIO 12610]|uniref:low-specificity L-threonine aldolase n=1 Tax=Kordiimonas sp. SCSIO 12610 TaxID=2829597 RepID=UPI00210DBA4D|nr:low-specificity L-threonine aldolase [Kordiimonas sp. SCSIO 12610]UTW56030.1 low-specificity L-threonine aldolase [Kordiimonas sp. SCSIO 12610]
MSQSFKYDFRSDTVTQPSGAMREAMMAAPLGDDVFGDDPTVKKLEAYAAERLGKEAALYVSSGTQSNLTALMAHCGRGEEYISGANAHCYLWEAGGAAVLGSIQPCPIPNEADGTIPLEKIRSAIKPDDPHMAMTKLLALENTIAGQPLSLKYMQAATDIARDGGLNTHLDGARGFNASVALGADIADMAKPFDTVSICLSKGLGAPIGSVLVGNSDLIAKARRIRKMLGGGMRQAGILAAAGLYALENNIERLADDHTNAKRLGDAFTKHDQIELVSCHTNIVIINPAEEISEAFMKHLHDNSVGTVGFYGNVRLVTHLDVSDTAIDETIRIVDRFFD